MIERDTRPVKLSVFNYCVCVYAYKVEYETICYVKEYMSDYIPVETCDLSLVCFWRRQPLVARGLLVHEVSRSHTTTHHSR